MKILKTLGIIGIKYPMREWLQHYCDTLKKVERVIKSCETLEQIGSAWKFADLFENYCKRINLNDQTRMVMRANINILLEDRLESLRLKKLNQNQ
jgi:hypothetical protein